MDDDWHEYKIAFAWIVSILCFAFLVWTYGFWANSDMTQAPRSLMIEEKFLGFSYKKESIFHTQMESVAIINASGHASGRLPRYFVKLKLRSGRVFKLRTFRFYREAFEEAEKLCKLYAITLSSVPAY